MVKKTEKSGQRKVTAVAAAVNKGAWTSEEDQRLVDYVMAHGDKKWRTLPAKAGLNRCGKSCRLRWLNYLRPGIKRGNISEDEEDLIIRLHNLIGNRWSLIAGRLPGRTDNEIKNFWNTHLSKKSLSISDLNSKLNVRLESSSNDNNVSLSPRSSSLPLNPTSFNFLSFPPKTNQGVVISDAPQDQGFTNGGSTTLSELDLETQVIGESLGVDRNYNVGIELQTCHSPSELWFQPFFDEEYRGYDDICVADMMDYNYKDCLLYFP